MLVAYVEHNHQILRTPSIVVAADLVIIVDALSLIVFKYVNSISIGRIETIARTTSWLVNLVVISHGAFPIRQLSELRYLCDVIPILDEKLELADLFKIRNELSIGTCRTGEPCRHREPIFIANVLLQLLFLLFPYYFLDRIVGPVHENEELSRNKR